MHNLATHFVLGFHGCEREVAENILAGAPFLQSKNDYDWLGEGAYFWENNEGQAWHFATQIKKCKNPVVIGAVINLGNCLNLTTRNSLLKIQNAYERLVQINLENKTPFPTNEGGRDRIYRRLDCAVIRACRQLNERQDK